MSDDPQVRPSAETLLERRPLTMVRGHNYLELPRDPQPWVIQSVLPVGGLVNVMGKPKLGKSFLGLGLACAVADPAVHEWMGYAVQKHGPVLYIQVDTPRSFWAARVKNLAEHGYNIDNIWWVDSLLAPYPFDMMSLELVNELKQRIQEVQPVLVVFDTLREIHQLDENDSTEMKRVLTNIIYSVRGTDATIVFISHTRKENASFSTGGKKLSYQDDLMTDGRGSSYIPSRMDVIMKLTEKRLMMKGRGLAHVTIKVQQDASGMIVQDKDKERQDSNIRKVLGMELSPKETAQVLASMEDIDIEAARTRLRRYKSKDSANDTLEDTDD
jgi:RecA-family ATPase